MPLVTYSDGSTYDGDLVDDVRHGQGTYTWKNGDTYTGTFVDGARSGEGNFTWYHGVSYTGTFVDGALTGEGVKTWTNGTSYTGSFVDGVRTGQGTMISADGSVFIGAWIDDKQNGEGLKVWADGTRYVGSYANGKQHGEGVKTWESGKIYVGTFANDQFNGEGTGTEPNGDVYTGTFSSNQYSGEGTLTKANGDVYTGTFSSNQLSGEGTLTIPNGDVYAGTFVNTKPMGGITAGEIPYFVGTATVAKPKTGITTTDALFYSTANAWANNNTYNNGTSTTITYSFSGTSERHLFEDGYSYPDTTVYKTHAFSLAQQAAVKLALEQISNVADITFVEVAETAAEVGTIRYGFTDFLPENNSGSAFAYTPGLGPKAGDIWFKVNSNKLQKAGGIDVAFERGTDHMFKTLLHETGHALGLKHPHDGEVTMPTGLDQRNYSLMSYTEPENSYYYDVDGNRAYAISFTPMVYDIAALQHLYGAAVHNADDTVYKYDPDKPFAEAIWDSGGYDTLDLSDFKKGSTISLVPGAYSTIVVNEWTMTHNLGIAFGTTIEKVIGGSGNDIIKGNAANNTLYGSAGDDTLTGGVGYDTLVGGIGADTFVYTKGDGNDVIIGFEEGVDQISYSGFTAAEEAQFEVTTTAQGHSLITLTDGSTLLKRAELAEQHDLTGTVLSRGGGALSDVVVTADLSDANWQVTDTSAATGKFGLKIDSGSNLKLLADMTHTNASPTNAITAEDALEALRLSIGLNKTDGSSGAFDYMAADFNKDGKVTPQDALDIHKYALGLGDLTADWLFVDGAGDYSAITKANVAFTEGVSVAGLSAGLDIAITGILLGDVNDTYSGVAPTGLVLSSNALAENLAGGIVGTLSATDPDGDTITYSLASGGDNELFEIDGTTLKLKTGVSANYEVDNSYSVTVNASDGYLSSSLNTLVNVTNVNEANNAFYNGKVDGGVFETPYSGNDPAVEHLIGTKFWGTAGQGIDLTYSFMSADSSFYEHGDGPHYPYYYGITDIQTPSEALQAQVARVLSDISSVTLLNFSQVPTTGDVVGHIRIGVSPTGGAPFATNAGSGATSGDLWLTHTSYNDPALVIDGTSNSDTIAHEIGHTLGLNHPEGQMGTNVGQVHASKPYSVMAYPDYVGEVIDGKEIRWSNSTTLMIDDIAALQYLYGVNEQYKTGDDVYTLGSFDEGTTYNDYINAAIWDAGGIDTISWAGQTTVASINLGAGSFCFFGNITGTDSEELDDAAFEPGSGILGIGYNVAIENAIGGSNIDTIVGNNAANTLYGGAGAGVKDTLTGNFGADIFVCSLADAVTDATLADIITDFTNGTDLIGLEDRTWDDLTIVDSGSDTKIVDTSSNKILFVLQSFDHALIETTDFVVTDFV